MRVGAEKPEEEKGAGLHFQQVSVLGCSPYQRPFDLRVPRSATIVEITTSVPRDLDDLC